MQAVCRGFESGFPVYSDLSRRLHQRADSLAKPQNIVNSSFGIFFDDDFMTKQPIMIRVVVVCPVTWCYRVEYRRLDPSAKLAAG